MEKQEYTQEQIDNLLAVQQSYFRSGATRKIKFRLEQLSRLQSEIRRYQERIHEALYDDLGKHAAEALSTETGFVLHSITQVIDHLREWAQPRQVETPPYLKPAVSIIMHQPVGSVLIIGPYNYPFQLIIEPLVANIAAGNCAVVRPSADTPHTSALLTEILNSLFDPKYIAVMADGGVESAQRLTASRFDHIFFTGSTTVGKKIMAAAAQNLTPVTLELGGKCPVIVDATADLDNAAKRILWGKVLNAGQTCVAPDYVVAHKSICADLVLKMVKHLEKMLGPKPEDNRSYGRIVNHRHFDRLAAMLEIDRDLIMYGGNMDRDNRYMEPTILQGSDTAASMQEEIFGPLLPVFPYERTGEIYEKIELHPKPLALYLFTRDKKMMRSVARKTLSGGMAVNEVLLHLANPNLPFGGIGPSGIGKYHGYSGFCALSHEKSILARASRFSLPLLAPPYTKAKEKLMQLFFNR